MSVDATSDFLPGIGEALTRRDAERAVPAPRSSASAEEQDDAVFDALKATETETDAPEASETPAAHSPTDAADPEQMPASAYDLDLSPLEVLPRWTGRLLLTLGLLTVPWIAGLAVELPSRAESAHYDVSWAGFDVLLCALLLRTGWSALRKREHIEVTAAMTGALLIVDAWFDVMSSTTTDQFLAALTMAVCVELPLAVFCLWIAGRVDFTRRKRSERLTALVRRLDARRLNQVPRSSRRKRVIRTSRRMR